MAWDVGYISRVKSRAFDGLSNFRLMIWKHYRVYIWHIDGNYGSVLVSGFYFIHSSSEWQLGLDGKFEVYCSGVLVLAAALTYQYKKIGLVQTIFRPSPYRNLQKVGLVQAHILLFCIRLN
ncbi:hypothetical protein PVAP13_1NG483519 [Panicum virgatum]|uniref:Uncharacterized protein n=1 Tax=Panicum virgatum TaxID=38727 RepID=A0A8T0XAP6_PANVG|nr:hypothetical protein PVAP13_1NG483519 [Panicum virgatum]